MLELRSVYKRYPGGQDALSDLSLSLSRGEMAFLTGHSGAGKSTLLKLIALLERPTRGQIIVNGVNLSRIKSRHIPEYRQGLGLIFQNYNLLYDRSVFDNVALPLVIRGLRHDDIGRRVRAALDTVGLLRKERAQPITLSGGEQQRVAIARSVVCKPHVLLADEPTGNLDPALSAEIMRLFARLNEVGVTTLIATHDISLIERMGRRIIHLDQGRLSDAQPESVIL
ncbi:MAG: cell division ATP-binding protein FtsE [Salinisphaeraceae bacterium]|nr:cell division ATP-binding protein FtsE [Salinisphaeraceae bacterium]